MTRRIRLGIIGLGAMGSEMLDVAEAHPEVQVTMVADRNPSALDRGRAYRPSFAFTTEAMELVESPEVDAVYVAVPPQLHARYALPALERGKAVFCEKPLAVNLLEAETMAEAARRAGCPNAVNFALADRFLGPLDPLYLRLEEGAPGASEIGAFGLFQADRVPVKVTGQVGTPLPESYEWFLYGSRRSYRFMNWDQLDVCDGQDWVRVPLEGPRGTEHTRLTAFAEAVRGDPSTLPDFETGLRVARAVESFHAPKAAGA